MKYRGIELHPAGVPVHLVFEESVSSEFFEAVFVEWASLKPQKIEFSQDDASPATVVVATRPSLEVRGDWGQQVKILTVAAEQRAHERLTVEVTLSMLEALAGRMGLFHAAALGDSASKNAVILVGPSGKGKTTATRFLGQHLAYLSDETAVVQPDGRLRPYPKPLSLIEVAAKPKAQRDPTALGLKPVEPDDFSYHLKNLVVLGRNPEFTGQPYLERIALADALIEVVQQTSGLVRTVDGIEKLIELIQRNGGAYRLVYAEIEDTLELMRSLVEGNFALPEKVSSVKITPTSSESHSENLQRYPGSVAYEIDGRTLLQVEQRIIEISIFAADCWYLLEEPLTCDQLKAEVEELYGQIPEADFRDVLNQLKAQNILA